MQASTERRSCCSALICRPGAPSCVREPKTNFFKFKRAMKFSFLINSFISTRALTAFSGNKRRGVLRCLIVKDQCWRGRYEVTVIFTTEKIFAVETQHATSLTTGKIDIQTKLFIGEKKIKYVTMICS